MIINIYPPACYKTSPIFTSIAQAVPRSHILHELSSKKTSCRTVVYHGIPNPTRKPNQWLAQDTNITLTINSKKKKNTIKYDVHVLHVHDAPTRTAYRAWELSQQMPWLPGDLLRLIENAKQPPDADSGRLEHKSIPLKSIEMQNTTSVPGNVTVTGGIHSPVL